jgi:hypothetical protein
MSATLTRGARPGKAWVRYLRDLDRSLDGPARIVHDDQGAYFEINLD